MKIKTILYITLAGLLAGCGTTAPLLKTSPRLPSGNPERYKFALSRNSQFTGLVLRNIRIDYQGPGMSSKLSGAVKIRPDSMIMLSLRAPLGIEVSRILYTPDSIRMVDRRNKRVIISNYEDAAALLPLELEYRILETLFTGNIPARYRTLNLPDPVTLRDTMENETYLGAFRAPRETKRKNFYGWIYKDILKPSYLVFYQEGGVDKMRIHFRSYQREGGEYFPEKVEVEYNKDRRKSILKMDIGHFSQKEELGFDMGIPSSYKTIRH